MTDKRTQTIQSFTFFLTYVHFKENLHCEDHKWYILTRSSYLTRFTIDPCYQNFNSLAWVKKCMQWTATLWQGEPIVCKRPTRCRNRQWSRLGSLKDQPIRPLLFLLFINDTPSVINVQTLPFADSVMMMSPCSQSGSEQCLEVVLKLRSPNLLLSSGHFLSLSRRFHTGQNLCYRLGRSHEWFLLTSHALQRGCLQSKTCAVFDKAVFIIPQINPGLASSWVCYAGVADTDCWRRD